MSKRTKQEQRDWLNARAREEHTEDVIADLLSSCDGLLKYHIDRFNFFDTIAAEAAAQEGLLKAVYSYDRDNPTSFLTYSSVCIYNSLGGFYRKVKNTKAVVSLDKEMVNGEDVTFVALIEDGTNLERDAIDEAVHKDLQDLIYKVAFTRKTDSHVDILLSWIDSNFKMTQQDLMVKHGVSQSYISRIQRAYKDDLQKEIKKTGVLIR